MNQNMNIPQFDVYQPVHMGSKEQTSYVALDCEMVSCYNGNKPCSQELARVTIVNYDGYIIFDQHYKPKKKIRSYLTRFSGITAQDLDGAPPFNQKHRDQVLSLLKGKTIVGHSLSNDFSSLRLREKDLAELEIKEYDISDFPEFRDERNNKYGLKSLCDYYFEQSIQNGSHCSAVDSRTAMYLFRIFEKEMIDFFSQPKEKKEKKQKRPRQSQTIWVPKAQQSQQSQQQQQFQQEKDIKVNDPQSNPSKETQN